MGNKDNTSFYIYGKTEIDYLKSKDLILKKAIDDIGIVKRKLNTDTFSALLESIVNQQISSKAAETVWQRLVALLGEITVESVNRIDEEKIQQCGMSKRKAEYIKYAARSAKNGDIDFNSLQKKTDEDIIKELTSLKGIGVWSAQMLMIFSLQRPDIVSYDDLGIRRGIMKLYNLESLTKKEFKYYKELYTPYGTVASLYLWEIARL